MLIIWTLGHTELKEEPDNYLLATFCLFKLCIWEIPQISNLVVRLLKLCVIQRVFYSVNGCVKGEKGTSGRDWQEMAA